MDQDEERWLPIPGEPGYEVSSIGRVRSWRAHIGGGLKATPSLLRPDIAHNGYARYRLSTRKHMAHILVLIAFVGPRPPGMVCRHFPDRDPLNNCPENLSWGTPEENCADKAVHGTLPIGDRHGSRTHPEAVLRGERISTAKLSDADVIQIRAMRKAGKLVREVAAHFGVSISVISSVARGKTWAHIKSS